MSTNDEMVTIARAVALAKEALAKDPQFVVLQCVPNSTITGFFAATCVLLAQLKAAEGAGHGQ